MSCGADYSAYEASYDEYVAYAEYERGQHYDGDRSAYSQQDYSRDVSKSQINADILADQVAGYK